MMHPFLFAEPVVECLTSLESSRDRIYLLDMEKKEKEDLCDGYMPQQQTKIQEPQNRMKSEDKQHRLRPPG